MERAEIKPKQMQHKLFKFKILLLYLGRLSFMSHIFSFSKYFFFLTRAWSSLWAQYMHIQPQFLPPRPFQIPTVRVAGYPCNMRRCVILQALNWLAHAMAAAQLQHSLPTSLVTGGASMGASGWHSHLSSTLIQISWISLSLSTSIHAESPLLIPLWCT